jgi:hypothetical protein
VKIARATVSVNGGKAKPFTGTITLRGLPKGRYPVKVAVKLADGRAFTVTRRYRTCAPRSRSLSSHSRSLLSGSSAYGATPPVPRSPRRSMTGASAQSS